MALNGMLEKDIGWRDRPVTRFQAIIVAATCMTVSSIILIAGFLIFGANQSDIKKEQKRVDFALCKAASQNRTAIISQAARGAQSLGDFAIDSAEKRGASEAALNKLKSNIYDFVVRIRDDAADGLDPISCTRPQDGG